MNSSTWMFLLMVGVAAAADFIPIGYKECKGEFKVSKVEASGCTIKELDGGKKMCQFTTGTTPVIRITFTPTSAVDSLLTTVKAKNGATMLDFPIADNNACIAGGLKCPLKADQEYIYEQGISIASNYPKNQQVQVNWSLSRPDKTTKDVCIVFLGNIIE